MRTVRGRGLSLEDRRVVGAFRAFLEDPTSRCGICLADDHTRPSQCPEVPDGERRVIGIMVMDVNMAKRLQLIAEGQQIRKERSRGR